MTADSSGNDILAVGVPVTGFIGIAPYGTTIPTPSQGASESLVLDPAFKKLVDRFIPNLFVLSFEEILSTVEVRSLGSVELSDAD